MFTKRSAVVFLSASSWNLNHVSSGELDLLEIVVLDSSCNRKMSPRRAQTLDGVLSRA